MRIVMVAEFLCGNHFSTLNKTLATLLFELKESPASCSEYFCLKCCAVHCEPRPGKPKAEKRFV